MEEGYADTAPDDLYPVLLLPKNCTSLETNCDVKDNVFINLNITTPDTEGNETCIYSGFCNIKLVDTYKINVESHDNYENDIPVIITETQTYPTYNQSQVWIDPMRSPYVYNQYDGRNSQECYSVCHDSHTGQITVEQHNMYITQNVFNYNESIEISPEPEQTKHRKHDSMQNSDANFNFYEDHEFDCEPYQSQLSEEIINEREARTREEKRFVGVQSEASALKQLMSTDVDATKQRKTILFLGQDSQSGQTIQNISVNDPSFECIGNGEIDHEVIIEDSSTSSSNPKHKKYQCDKCKKIFVQISSFKQHMVNTHRQIYDAQSNAIGDVKYMCKECGKSLKSQEKFEQHCMGHGDPELECNKCHKVFASKFTLRTHRKIHTRKYPCKLCIRSYTSSEDLRVHVAKIHLNFSCTLCPYTSKKYSELMDHETEYEHNSLKCPESNETDLADDALGEIDDTTTVEEELKVEKTAASRIDQVREADSVLAKVMSNKIFLLHSSRARKDRKFNKVCEVCYKNFDRIGDLKRHLIEHIIKSTLAKSPVADDGTLSILCGICQAETFTKIDKYKAHLREHAKLTLYKCTFCDKSFSDSSNFSKHKKIHGTTYFQCDLCLRKFNSKKMITQHMEYHNVNSPVSCHYCGKIYHFESMLNKHIKSTHAKEIYSRFKCRFCVEYYKTLKEKWDHEWNVHNVRKTVVDCPECGVKFRKYSELKRHCNDNHMIEIPPAKKFMRNKVQY